MAPNLTTAVDDAWPGLMTEYRKVVALYGIGLVTICGGLSYYTLATGGKATDPILIMIALIGGAGYMLQAKMHKVTGKALMPTLLKLAEFDYAPVFHGLSDLRDAGLLPVATNTRGGEFFSGRVGVYPFVFGEVDVRWVHRSRTIHGTRKADTYYFHGVVVVLPSLGGKEPMTVVAKQSKIGSREIRNRLKSLHTMKSEDQSASGQDLCVFGVNGASDHPFIPKLRQIEVSLPGDATLFSAYQGKDCTAIAFESEKNQFAMGGLIMSRGRLVKQVDHALQDLTLPLRIISILIADD